MELWPNDRVAKGALKLSQRWLKDYRRGAALRDIPWRLTDEEFMHLVSQACYYCNQPPMTQVRIVREERRVSKEKLNGLDRKDSNKGYTLKNCVPCCKNCNWAKMTFSEADFLAHVEKIFKYWKSK